MNNQKMSEDDFQNEIAITFEAISSVNAWLGDKKKDMSREELDKVYEDRKLHIKATKIYEERQSEKRSSEIQSIVERLRKEK